MATTSTRSGRSPRWTGIRGQPDLGLAPVAPQRHIQSQPEALRHRHHEDQPGRAQLQGPDHPRPHPIDFYQWQGKSWVVLFSHPADFTPVCTTELGRIAVHAPFFEQRNVKLLAHSCDKLKSHQDWVNDIKDYCKDIPGAFPYPIIGDETRELAVRLDMIDEDQKDDPETAMTVRALYVISPDHRLRLSMQYPVSTGRNVDEMLRVIDSLQLTDRLPYVATPANWVPGEKVMILPSVEEADIPKLFPRGVDRVTMPSGVNYVRTTTDY